MLKSGVTVVLGATVVIRDPGTVTNRGVCLMVVGVVEVGRCAVVVPLAASPF